MRIGVISSSAGFTFEQLWRGVQHLDVNFAVVTDRECGIERVCDRRGIACERIVATDRQEFSVRSARALKSQGVEFVLLLFNRIVTADLYEVLPVYNIHPSLLPAFPGLSALKEARARGVRFVGATMHLVSEHADDGPIVAQVSTPIRPPVTEATLGDISFMQRIYLSLLAVDLHTAGLLVNVSDQRTANVAADRPYSGMCNPCIVDERMLAFMKAIEEERGIEVTQIGRVISSSVS